MGRNANKRAARRTYEKGKPQPPKRSGKNLPPKRGNRKSECMMQKRVRVK